MVLSQAPFLRVQTRSLNVGVRQPAGTGRARGRNPSSLRARSFRAPVARSGCGRVCGTRTRRSFATHPPSSSRRVAAKVGADELVKAEEAEVEPTDDIPWRVLLTLLGVFISNQWCRALIYYVNNFEASTGDGMLACPIPEPWSQYVRATEDVLGLSPVRTASTGCEAPKPSLPKTRDLIVRGVQMRRRRRRQPTGSPTWTFTTAPPSTPCWRPSASPPCSPPRRSSRAGSPTPRCG
jgi:hypothetical protein